MCDLEFGFYYISEALFFQFGFYISEVYFIKLQKSIKPLWPSGQGIGFRSRGSRVRILPRVNKDACNEKIIAMYKNQTICISNDMLKTKQKDE